jgi:hypothetical protein
MGFCPECGAKLLANAKFCAECGFKTVAGSDVGSTNTTATQEGAPRAPPRPERLVSTPSIANTASSMRTEGKPDFAPSVLTKPLSSMDMQLQPILEGLKKIYRESVLPLEKMYRFDEFGTPSLTDTDLECRPMVMLLGQYSTGKTSFIRYMLERDFPGVRIGPEPTTDRFTAIMYGNLERTIPGNALAVQTDKPFTALNRFGMAFLNKLEGVECASPILEKITFIDTPGARCL